MKAIGARERKLPGDTFKQVIRDWEKVNMGNYKDSPAHAIQEIGQEPDSPAIIEEETFRLGPAIAETLPPVEPGLTSEETESPIEVEHDIWVQLPPTREFTMRMKVEFLGRAKPDPLPLELVDDEE
jgi:hypothetical protein